ncbi:GroES-like protein [Metschnikowia bicuspidata var. bicuspidata NRRL YB-4993]|uniref:GroES-like protein n=1 Tax=Metschnikowia bicuspidata var. bicuspidata NRRL YB-4993 TaxID=869754 RepID=A0A1A0HL73_9ASCO|nr:GroES-like protein [Metschnikowia bicuspidata var. bicuspidata NRRL YB-4993]OBA24563.1 GroES-like protein [Metschnikowia bicuspidata var. bicuspidata NRRL YB-4993]
MITPRTQTGYGFKRGSKEIVKFENLPVPEPSANGVLLKIEAAGLCRSDDHILISQNPGSPDVMVMGHEICGTIAQAGSAIVDNLRYKVGARFCMFISDSCGSCDNCREGRDNHCSVNTYQAFGITKDGGFQEYLLVENPRNLIPIPDSVSFKEAASATDAILTPFHAIMKVKSMLSPTSKVLVLGAGGLGLHAIQILRHFDCKIICVDQKPENEDLVKSLGAHEFYRSFQDVDYKQESFDVSFDFIGNQNSVDCSCKYIGSNGKIVMIGMGKLRVMLPNYDLSRREVEVIYNFGGTSREQGEVLKWIAAGKIKPIVETQPMDQLPDYMRKMRRGEIVGRVAFKPVSKL